MKLRTLYLLLAVTIVAPVAVFSGIAFAMLLASQRDAATRRIEETARTTSVVIEADLERARAVLRVLANSHALATGDLHRFYQEAGMANAGPARGSSSMMRTASSWSTRGWPMARRGWHGRTCRRCAA